MSVEEAHLDAVAVIGMAGRYPGVRNLDEFWELLAQGREATRRLSDQELRAAGVPDALFRSPDYVRSVVQLEDVDCFDASLFGYSPREASLMDPQSRVALELAWHALEDAGYDPLGVRDSTGVFASASMNTYLLDNLAARVDRQDFVLGLGNIPVVLGNAPDFIATRISYKLNLRGPSLAIQTACSSSLVAVHLARQSLLNGECDMALAGGVSIYLPQDRGYLHREGMILSRDGHCRAFDASADGVMFGRGGGMVLLKRLDRALEDGDRIRAVLIGSAVNNDGSRKVGFVAPSVEGQARVIAEALGDAGVEAASISHVEAHGTGTRVGDPIEIAGLTRAFRQVRDRARCALSTVKSNVGHLDVAAGVTGLIKSVLMLEHRELVPSVNFHAPNPEIDFSHTPFYVNTQHRPWQPTSGVRRAGVSAFGFGGTNAHVVLEEAPAVAGSGSRSATPLMLRVTGATPEAVDALCAAHAAQVERRPSEAAALCATANLGRSHLAHRAVVVADDALALRAALHSAGATATANVVRGTAPRQAPKLAFVFSGMGSQYPGMGADLHAHEPVFRDAIDRCAALLDVPGRFSLREILCNQASARSVDSTDCAQPALFAFEYALAKLWQSWGVEPAALIGHSLGEYVAACLADVVSLEDALRIVSARGRLIGSLPAGGTMASVRLSESALTALLHEGGHALEIAALNGPDRTVLSGDATALEALERELRGRGIETQTLRVSHAFHSRHLDPILAEFERVVATARLSPPRIPVVSNVTGRLLTADEACSPAYWRQHARRGVRFVDGVRSLEQLGVSHFLEIGPQAHASALVADCAGDEGSRALASLRRGQPAQTRLRLTAAQLYVDGIELQWERVGGALARRVATPLYPFARERHWIDRGDVAVIAPGDTAALVADRVESPLIAQPVFALNLDSTAHPYLAAHRIQGQPIVPATAFLLAALEAGRRLDAEARFVIRDFGIGIALPVETADALRCQLIATARGTSWQFEVLARSAGVNATAWRSHVTGRLDPLAAPTDMAAIDVAAILDRCGVELDGTAFYERIARDGFDYAGPFRGVRQLFVGDGEAIGFISASVLAKPVSDTWHPAVLDACLQTVLALSPAGTVLLPVGVGQASVDAPPPSRFIAHATLTRDADSRHLATVRIVDEAGRTLALLESIELRPARAKDVAPTESFDDWLYVPHWEAKPLPERGAPLPAASDLAAAMRWSLPIVTERHGLRSYAAAGPRLHAASLEFVAAALDVLGWRPVDGATVELEAMLASLRILPIHRPMLRRMLEMLVEGGELVDLGSDRWCVRGDRSQPRALPSLDSLRRDFPQFHSMIDLTDRCGRALAGCLTGDIRILDVLFPGGSLADMEELYHRSPFALAYNQLVADAITAWLAAAGPDRRLRVLEVGAGTGGTSAVVLPLFPADRTTYVYTDLSRLFLGRAEERFAQYPFIEYRLLDAEIDAQAQGFVPGSYDLVIASNVLHTTADLGRTLEQMRLLLAPGGSLLMVEGIARQRWVDLLFGLTEGWWRFADHDVRSGYPLLTHGQWDRALANAGYRDVHAIPDAGDAEALFNQAVIVASRPVSVAGPEGSAAPGWVIVGAEGKAAQRLATAAAARGRTATVIDAREAPDADALAREIGAASPVEAVIFVPSPETVRDTFDSTDSLSSLRLLLLLAQALERRPPGATPRLWVVTCDGCAVLPGDSVDGLSHASLHGLSRTIALEDPGLRCTVLDLASADEQSFPGLVIDEIAADPADAFIAIRRGVRHVETLGHPAPRVATAEGWTRLHCPEPGLLAGIVAEAIEPRSPGRGEVSVRVVAAGLNFKDVLTAMGRFPAPLAGLGHECAGWVTAIGEGVTHVTPGDAVVAFARGSLASDVIADGRLVVHKPRAMTFEEAVTMPGAFLTAHASLVSLARLRAGERVLIHAATGGVGLAAVQLARRIGAEVHATAGSEAKRDFLRGLGLAHVFPSRTTDFVDAVRVATGGAGVDVILNSTTGDLLRGTASLLAPRGRFVELARDTGDAAPGLAPGCTYANPDVASDCFADPSSAGAVLRDIFAAADRGELHALPPVVFTADDAPSAFRLMARAGHIGKVVLRFAPDGTLSHARDAALKPDATYLIAGGLGGLGLLLAAHFIEHGASHVALLARREPTGEERATIARLTESGARIRVLRADVADAGDVSRAIATIAAEGPPLRGVIQAAGVLDDGVLAQQDWRRFRHVLAPKVDGAWNLHRATLGCALDFFVLFSSIASMMGSAGQGNHSAANAFLDGLAAHRRARGLPAQSINWGPWADIGAAARGGYAARLAERGFGTIAPAKGLAAFDWIRAEDLAQVGVLPLLTQRASTARAATAAPPPDPGVASRIEAATGEDRRRLVMAFAREEVCRGLGLAENQAIDPRRALVDLGVDSLLAVELRNTIGKGLALPVRLPATLLFDYPTLDSLTDYLLGCLGSPPSTAVAVPAAATRRTSEEEAIANLSDEEAAAELLRELGGAS